MNGLWMLFCNATWVHCLREQYLSLIESSNLTLMNNSRAIMVMMAADLNYRIPLSITYWKVSSRIFFILFNVTCTGKVRTCEVTSIRVSLESFHDREEGGLIVYMRIYTFGIYLYGLHYSQKQIYRYTTRLLYLFWAVWQQRKKNRS